MPWLKRPAAAPVIEDLTPLLNPGWTGGRVTAVRAVGGAVQITAENLTRVADGQGVVEVLTLPARLQPAARLLGQRHTFRGKQVSTTLAGAITITDPRGIADHLDLTYVAKGGV